MPVRSFLAAATVVAAAASATPAIADGAVTASCTASVTAIPATSDATVFVHGSAQASGAIATLVRCIVRNGLGQTIFDLHRTEAGSLVSMYGRVQVANVGPYLVCQYGEGLYANADRVGSATTCHY